MKHDMINISLQRYGTRMLQAGDPFQASRKEARVLQALKKAHYAEEQDEAPEPPTDGEELAALRRQYQEKTGKRPFNGWDAAALREKLATASER